MPHDFSLIFGFSLLFILNHYVFNWILYGWLSSSLLYTGIHFAGECAFVVLCLDTFLFIYIGFYVISSLIILRIVSLLSRYIFFYGVLCFLVALWVWVLGFVLRSMFALWIYAVFLWVVLLFCGTICAG